MINDEQHTRTEQLTNRRISSFSNMSFLSYGSQHVNPLEPPSTAVDINENVSGTFTSNQYDNSKNIRRESSFASLVSEQAQQTLIRVRSPREIVSSFYNDMSWVLFRGFGVSIVTFFVGCAGPKLWVLPLMGGLTMRPIPYQMTNAGDVLLDLELANELIPKADVTFPCKCWVWTMMNISIDCLRQLTRLNSLTLSINSWTALVSITLGPINSSYRGWWNLSPSCIISTTQQPSTQYSCRHLHYFNSNRNIRVCNTGVQVLCRQTSS